LKFDLIDVVGDCANNENVEDVNTAATRRITCGNLEDKLEDKVGMLWITPAC
jgi:hypothetical protein